MSREQLVLEEGRVGGRSAGGVELEGNGVVVEKVLLTQLEVAAEELADETVGWCDDAFIICDDAFIICDDAFINPIDKFVPAKSLRTYTNIYALVTRSSR